MGLPASTSRTASSSSVKHQAETWPQKARVIMKLCRHRVAVLLLCPPTLPVRLLVVLRPPTRPSWPHPCPAPYVPNVGACSQGCSVGSASLLTDLDAPSGSSPPSTIMGTSQESASIADVTESLASIFSDLVSDFPTRLSPASSSAK